MNLDIIFLSFSRFGCLFCQYFEESTLLFIDFCIILCFSFNDFRSQFEYILKTTPIGCAYAYFGGELRCASMSLLHFF